MAKTAAADSAFKNWFNAELFQLLAKELGQLEPAFDQKTFFELTLNGLEQRELMERLRQTAIAINAALPGSYLQKLAVVRRLAPRLPRGFVTLSLCDFVAREGLEHSAPSLEALKFLTPFGSAEFALRPFILKDPEATLDVILGWASDPDEHVRRLASEGSRPRLPWGMRLNPIIANPDLTAPILEKLKSDPSLYVRKSVANHLNDISKDHPAWVLKRLKSWDLKNPATAWIARHALRTLVKKGHPKALAFFGAKASSANQVRVEHFTVSPRTIRQGQSIQLEASLLSRSKKSLSLVVDYVIHYPRATGHISEKVFKWARLDLQANTPTTLTKRQVIKDFSIRKHHPGRHVVELQINGRRLAKTAFVLV